MHVAETLVPEPSYFKVEKLKRYKITRYWSNSNRTDPSRR